MIRVADKESSFAEFLDEITFNAKGVTNVATFTRALQRYYTVHDQPTSAALAKELAQGSPEIKYSTLYEAVRDNAQNNEPKDIGTKLSKHVGQNDIVLDSLADSKGFINYYNFNQMCCDAGCKAYDIMAFFTAH